MGDVFCDNKRRPCVSKGKISVVSNIYHYDYNYFKIYIVCEQEVF